MSLKRILRYMLLIAGGVLAFILLFAAFSLAPVDRTPAAALPSYPAMMRRLDTLRIDIPETKRGFSVGFAKVNITPASPMATAGYGKRKARPYVAVHDSIYIRAMVLENGGERVAIVAADLLIMPPTVTRMLEKKLNAIGFSLDNTYLGATHSHNSIGHWGEGATRFIYGAYRDSVVQFLADAIVRSVSEAAKNVLPSRLTYGAIPVPDAVENRLIDGGNEDPFLRVIEVKRRDSSRLVLMTYDAHATCLSQKTIELSRDYPGRVVDELESKGYDFAMFMGGAVGSHRETAPMNDWACMDWMAEHITERFFAERDSMQALKDSSLVMARVPLLLGDPQVKIARDWKLRPWLFRTAFGEYDHFLTVLRIGDVVMLGAPCDFSGEFSAALDSTARRHNLRGFATSFNGGYIGYLTPGKYYDINHYETRLMNWYAPGTGEYVRTCLEKLMIAASDTN
jgi:hypothetical protein